MRRISKFLFLDSSSHHFPTDHNGLHQAVPCTPPPAPPLPPPATLAEASPGESTALDGAGGRTAPIGKAPAPPSLPAPPTPAEPPIPVLPPLPPVPPPVAAPVPVVSALVVPASS